MSQKVSSLSGFPEYLPAQQIILQSWLDTIRKSFESFGYAPIDTPAIERLSTLVAKGAAEHEIYTIGRYQQDSQSQKEELGLRFDLTVPLARYVALHGASLVFPFKRYHIGPVWRGERPQKGRFRQFIQCDIDILGHLELSELYDVEILETLASTLKSLNIGSFKIQVNHKALLSTLLSHLGVGSHQHADCMRVLDKRLKISPDLFLQELSTFTTQASDLIDLIDKTSGPLAQSVEILQSHPLWASLPKEVMTVFQALLSLSQHQHLPLYLNLGLARGLAYYTGLVLETFLDDHPQFGSIASGGRYDKLAEQFSSQKRPGVGLSIGISRLFDAYIQHQNLEAQPHQKAQILIAPQYRPALESYRALAQKLRQHELSCDIYWEEKKLSDQMKYADKKSFRYIVFANQEEIQQGRWVLKDLLLRTQQDYSESELIEILRA